MVGQRPARAPLPAGSLRAPARGLFPTEQNLREAFRGFLAGPVALQFTPHLDHASRLVAGLGDAVQPGLVRLGRCPPDGSMTSR
jgi:hypothetical protein